MKRLMDLVLALIALVGLMPLMLLAALAVALESGWPVLFRQTRVGVGGREFGMYKLRSMVRHAGNLGPHYTLSADPRITRVGRVIRRTSLDELPQLFNVLRGDMSLVGPRPALPVQRSLYDDAQWAERCSVRPGITGLAQVALRSQGTLAECIALDLQYVRQHTLAMDLKIMWRTLGRLSGRGAN